MFARVCVKCHEYVVYCEFDSYNGANMMIHSFELDHEDHELISINIDDFEEIDEFDDVTYFYSRIKFNMLECHN